MSRLTNLYVRGEIEEHDHLAERRRIQQETGILRTRLNGRVGVTVITTALDDGFDGWQGWDPTRRRAVLKAVFSEIVVKPSATGAIPSMRQRVGSGETTEQFAQRRFETLSAEFDDRIDFRLYGAAA